MIILLYWIIVEKLIFLWTDREEVTTSSLPPLKKYSRSFEQLVNFDYLLPRLYQDDNLKPEEYETIRQERSLGCRIVSLFLITENKGKEGVKGLIQSLERERQHTGHEELAAELKQGLYVCMQVYM